MDVGKITDAQWNSIVASIDQLSLSLTQRLTRFYILHRAYYTPKRLFMFGGRPDASRPRCVSVTGDLIHMLWRCPKLYRYCKEVIYKINFVFGTDLRLDPMTCILWDLGL